MAEAPRAGPGQIRLAQTYAAGMTGRRAAVPFAMNRLEALAAERMTPEAFGYLRSAGAESTARANRAGLDAVRFVPRMLRDVGARALGITLFGRALPAPLLLAPIGVQDLAHSEGDLATAKGAACR